MKKINQISTVVFVCEHGAAKSILAAAYFNRFAQEKGLNLRAIARGTNPDEELSPQTVKGLLIDGLDPTESTPQKLTPEDMQSAQRIITLCELSVEHPQQVSVERWDDIPPVSENYELARDTIIEHVRYLLNQLSSTTAGSTEVRGINL